MQHYLWQFWYQQVLLSSVLAERNKPTWGGWYSYYKNTCGYTAENAEIAVMWRVLRYLGLAETPTQAETAHNTPQYRMPQPETAYTAIQPETASRKARTKQDHTPLAGIGAYTETYQTPALQQFSDWLNIGATHGPSAFYAAIRKAGYMPHPPDTSTEARAMHADTGMLVIAGDVDKTTQRETLRASIALFTVVLDRAFSQPSADYVAVNVLRPMLAGDIRYIAASAGLETALDRVSGNAPMSPRIATYCTWLLASMVYVCEQLHTSGHDTIRMPQAEAYEAISLAEQQHKARKRKASNEHHKQAGKWHDVILKDEAIRKLERKAASQASGKPKGYRHH